MTQFDDEDDGVADPEWPDPADMDAEDNDSVDTVVCPDCRRRVYEDADLCPHCGQFIVPDEPNRRPLWITVGIIGCLIVIAMLIFR